MTRGECWETAHAETAGLPSFLLHRERDRRFAELCAAVGDPPCLVARVPVIPVAGSIVGGIRTGGVA